MRRMKKLAAIGLCMILTAVTGLTAFAAPAGGEEMEGYEMNYTPMPFDGTVISVEDGALLMSRMFDWGGTEELVVYLNDDTRILDAVNGYPVPVENLSTGEPVRVYVGPAMTLSLPPKANGMVVLCDIPADAGFPVYTDVKELTAGENGTYTLTTVDGTVVTVNGDTMILPYLTRNMVQVQDLTPGTTILLWTSAGDPAAAEKIVIFQNTRGGYDTAGAEVTEPEKYGWEKTEDGWYYYEDGEPVTGWLWDGADWYYMNPETGLMHTGFLTLNGKTYYLKADGRMLTEPHLFVPNANGELYF